MKRIFALFTGILISLSVFGQLPDKSRVPGNIIVDGTIKGDTIFDNNGTRVVTDDDAAVSKIGEAVSTVTQIGSHKLSLDMSLWTGAVEDIQSWDLEGVASITVDQDSRLSIGVNGSEKVSVLNNGFVGIGDIAPTASLEIHGDGTGVTYGLQVHNSTGINNGFVVRNDTRVGIGILPTAGEFQMKSSASAGSINAVLFENSTSEDLFRIRDDGNVYFHDGGMTFYNSTNSMAVTGSFVAGQSSVVSNVRAFIKGSGATSATRGLEVHNSTGTNNALVVRDDSRVGIGTSAPDTKLHIKIDDTGVTPINNAMLTIEQNFHAYLQFLGGAARSSGLIFGDGSVNNRAHILWSDAADHISLSASAGGASDVHVYTDRTEFIGNMFIGALGTTPTARLHVKGVGTSPSVYALKVDDGSNNPLMHVTSAGSVGIGVTAPSSMLHVLASLTATSPTNGTLITLEQDANTYLQFLAGVGNSSGMLWGDEAAANRAHFLYDDTNERFSLSASAGGASDVHYYTDKTEFLNPMLIGALTAPSSVAMLEVTSTTKGFRLTPMTATQASAITPIEGLQVFVSNTNGTFTTIGFWGYENGSWVDL